VALVGPTVWLPTEYVKLTASPPYASAWLPEARSCRSAVMVWPVAVPAASNSRAAELGGCHACVQLWSDVVAPVRPVFPTPWTLNVSASPSSPRSLAELTMMLVREAGTETWGAWPTKPVVHEVPITFHDVAGTLHLAPLQGAHDTTHAPRPSVRVVTEAGAPGPFAVVTKLAGADGVDCSPM
jgi:hypothetical protein